MRRYESSLWLINMYVVSGVTMISAGSYKLIIAGMPAGMQKVDGQLPGPPACRSAVMPSQIFLYSGVSGGWPASRIQLFGLPGGRIHCPLKSGYFPKSTTWATQGVANSAATIATAPIELRWTMMSILHRIG